MTKARTNMLEGITGMIGGIDFGGSSVLDDLTTPSSAFGAGVFSSMNGGSFFGGAQSFFDIQDSIASPSNKGIF